ncbi:HTH-type transcriptional regulator UlaR [Pasteurella atlantica]|uniref:HTH-type transcriptional regulator UlaR n=1 Tax=Pasteurellaceae TaxID=712 RepID=UPI00276CDE5C|nr:HTH-type transcriptional regulator UlaR [Pasteurella atlantica]MDP8099150.1 HTH-type transcriptional regulator UlaR [Pasteurella atlantica]MDP8107176.1 HTH-type transcriptional regulator UlaR [Pasteurella atlantica]MDP8116867.1 HTH-type transcriptional regulator UlaR [Pasteurella atlantica]
MNENYRQQQLLKLVNERKYLATAEIIDLLGISPATARRDITKLDQQGRLKKVRNGAESLNATYYSTSSPIIKKNINNLEEKKRIAIAANKLCKEDTSVILTCGSTMLMLGESLCGKNLQIITNYLPLANTLISNDHHNVVIMGGQYNKNQAIMLSLNSSSDDYAADILFTSGKGLSHEGLYKNDMLIANSEQKMLEKVEKLVVLLDSSKLGKRVGMLFAELKNIDILITGREADPTIIKELTEQGLHIILA